MIARTKITSKIKTLLCVLVVEMFFSSPIMAIDRGESSTEPNFKTEIDNFQISINARIVSNDSPETSQPFAGDIQNSDGVGVLSSITDPSFQQQAYLVASNAYEGNFFGQAIDIDGDTLVVGAPGESSLSAGVNANQEFSTGRSIGAVYVFTRDTDGWSQQAYIKASNATLNDEFGSSVALEGDTLVVGAPGVFNVVDQNFADRSGAVYVFTRSDEVWSEQAILTASNFDTDDQFGSSVALEGDTLVVGAPWEDSSATGIDGNQYSEQAKDSGAVYIFTRTGKKWIQRNYLKGPTGSQQFGHDLAISGDRLVVGLPSQDEYCGGCQKPNSGQVDVFTRSGTEWYSVPKLITASNIGYGDKFGYSVAVDGDTIAAGAPGEDSDAVSINGDQGDQNKTFDSGAVYVFSPSDEDYFEPAGPHWNQQAYIKASNSGEHDYFGTSVAVDGDTLVVGARGKDSNTFDTNESPSEELDTTDSGAVYVFTRTGTEWEQQSIIKAAVTKADDLFGSSIAIDGDTFVAGTPYADIDTYHFDGLSKDAGAVHAFALVDEVNQGHAGAWFNPETPGQGLLIDVDPERKFVFLAWFTFANPYFENSGEQHWFTAQGNYTGNKAQLIVYESLGGEFDDPKPVVTKQVGEASLSFTNCGLGSFNYNIEAWDLDGNFSIYRAIPGSEKVCENRIGTSIEPLDENAGWDGAYFDENSPGQGFLIDVDSDLNGDDLIFVAWFTFGDNSASGQRWLTAQGLFEGDATEITVYETTGGRFDYPQTTSTKSVGSLNIDFTDCIHAKLSYSISNEESENTIDIQRAIPGTNALCLELTGQN